MIDKSTLERALSAMGELLTSRGQHFEVVVVGGGNLILRDLIRRPVTKDVDLLGEKTSSGVDPLDPMPVELRDAIRDVGRAYGLPEDWMNLGPSSLLDLGLPPGFDDRLREMRFGDLVLWSASRIDMIAFKLYAAVDQGARSYHLQDLIDLEPTREELLQTAAWTRTQDPSPGYRTLLTALIPRIRDDISDDDIE